MTVTKNQQIISQGKRSTSGDRLWDIPIPQPICTPSDITSLHSTTVTPGVTVILYKYCGLINLSVYANVYCRMKKGINCFREL